MTKSEYGWFSFLIECILKILLLIGYVDELMSELMNIHRAESNIGLPMMQEFLCSKFIRPNKKEAVKEKQTRFSVSS